VITVALDLQALAQQLWQAKINGHYCDELANELSLESAYELQLACIESAPSGTSLSGYKIGATSDVTLAMLGLDEPFHGPVFNTDIHWQLSDESLTLPMHTQHGSRIEGELVVCMKSDLKRNQSDITLEEVTNNIDWIAPGFEIVASRFKPTETMRGLLAIADFGANQSMVIGKPYKDWQSLNIEKHNITVQINNDEPIIGHSGMSIHGNPLHFIVWLVNHPLMQNTGLKAGQFVSCGTCTGAPFIKANDSITGDFGALGKLVIAPIQQ